MDVNSPQPDQLDSIREEALGLAGLGLLRTTADGTVVFADKTALEVLEVPEDSVRSGHLVGHALADLTDCPIPVESIASELRRSGRIRRDEIAFQGASGDERWVLYDCYIVRNSVSGDDFVQFVIQDVTEHRHSVRQDRIRQIAVDSSVNAIAMADLDGTVTYANPAMASMWRFRDVGEVIGKSADSFWANQHLARHIGFRLLQHDYWSGQLSARRQDGTVFDVHLSANRVLDADGTPLCLMVSCVDITEQKRIEEELRKRVETERLIVRISTRLVSRLSRDLDTTVTDALRELGEFTDVLFAALAIRNLDEERVEHVFEWWKDGSGPRYKSLVGAPLSDFRWLTTQLIRGKSTVLEDIPEVGEDSPNPTIDSDRREGSLLIVPVQHNDRTTGVIALWTGDDAEPRDWGEQTENTMRIVGEIVANVIRRREAEEEVLRRVEFERIVTAVSSQFIGMAPNEIDGAIEEALRTVGEYLRVDRCYVSWISEENGVAIESFEWCAEGMPSFCNILTDIALFEEFPWAAKKLTQGEPLIFESLDELPDAAGRERRLMEQQDIKSLINVPITVSKRLIGLLGFETVQSHVHWSDDVVAMATIVGQVFGNAMVRKESEAERQHLEAQVRHAQKLESLGVLAGGIAHDFNNILMGIIGNAGLAMMELPSDSPVSECIVHIEKAAQHAAELTTQLLAYSGKGAFSLRPVNLTRIVDDMMHLVEAAVSKRAFLNVRLSPDVPDIDGDAGQLRQVVLNLVTNASDAVETTGGNIRIATGAMKADLAYLTGTYLQEDFHEGPYAFLEISDTGCGMDRQTLGRIFDPFFSTKFPGRGLGLAAVLGIVRAHRAAIKVDSTPGEGTVIRVLFPCRTEIKTPPKPAPPSLESDVSGGVVLVVDDEPVVRRVAKLTLERFGYDVLLAEDGREGVEVFRDRSGEINCILLDMTMPVMDGAEAYAQIRTINPSVPIILSSGYSEIDARDQLEESAALTFIQKPYTTVALVEAVGRAIREVQRPV